ncbi:MAG: M12 family metallo-peptidase [Pseudomonadota bacterium]
MIIKALNKNISMLACLIMSFIWSPVFSAQTKSTIDVLVLFTPGVATLYGADPSTKINQLFQVTNQIYADSNVYLEVRLAGTKQVNYTDNNSAETALRDLTATKHAAFKDVPALREKLKADMVIFYRPYKAVHGSCGIAWIGGEDKNGNFSDPKIKSFQFSHIAINSCGDFVTAHELGHNMGLRHSRKQEGKGGTFPYALGYGVENVFTDVMAYHTSFNVDYWEGKIYKFANPDLICKGLPCGVNRNTASGADAAYTLNITGPQIAKFYTAQPALSNSDSASSEILATSLKKMQEAKISADAAKLAVEKYKATLSQKTKALPIAQTAFNKAKSQAAQINTKYTAANKAYDVALSKLAPSQSKLVSAANMYNTSTTEAAVKKNYSAYLTTLKTYEAAVNAVNTAANQANALVNAVNSSNQALAVATDALSKAKTELEQAKTESIQLNANMQTTLSVYNLALKDYNAAVKVYASTSTVSKKK